MFGLGLMAGGAAFFGAMSAERRKDQMNRKMFAHQQHMDYHGAEVRATDLENAGLSKTLAAGNAASGS